MLPGEPAPSGPPAPAAAGTAGTPGPGNGGAGAQSSGGASLAGVTAIGGMPLVSGGTAGGDGSGGASGDAGAGGSPACPGSGVEVCNGIDDDCDGDIDEDLPLELVAGPYEARVDEGRTDEHSQVDCGSCVWAWYPQLVALGDHLGVVWYLGIYGGHEEPSAFGRHLGWDARPEAKVTSLGSQYWMSALRRGETTPRGTLLMFVERAAHADNGSFGFVDRDLHQGASVALNNCSGAAQIFAMAPIGPTLLSCSDGNLLRLYSVDDAPPRVTGQRELDVQSPGDPPTEIAGRAFAAWNGARGVLAVPATSGPFGSSTPLLTVAISSSGEPLGDPQRVLLDNARNLQLEGLFATSSGYVLFGEERSGLEWPSGRFVATLGPDGDVRGPIRHFDQGLKGFDETVVERVGDGFALANATAGGLTIEQLDSEGAVTHQLHQAVAPYSRPSLLFSHGALYVAFVETPDLHVPNRVLVSRFACDPAAPR